MALVVKGRPGNKVVKLRPLASYNFHMAGC